jgi:hypothetical protein
VKASHLNTRDVATSLKYKFGGKLRRANIRWQDTTSISLLIDDLECLLRNLYGDFDDDVIESTRQAILGIVQEFLRFTSNDLWLEHKSAMDIDHWYDVEALVEEGCDRSDILRGAYRGAAYLFDRVREFRRNPSAFSQYSANFLTAYETQCAQANLATAKDFIEFTYGSYAQVH